MSSLLRRERDEVSHGPRVRTVDGAVHFFLVLVDLILKAQGHGKTVVTSTNDLHIVPEIAGRVVVFGEDRRIIASGTPEAILHDRSVLRAANLIHRHRHVHGGVWREHEHPGIAHTHDTPPILNAG